jgi:hypothetical protein
MHVYQHIFTACRGVARSVDFFAKDLHKVKVIFKIRSWLISGDVMLWQQPAICQAKPVPGGWRVFSG